MSDNVGYFFDLDGTLTNVDARWGTPVKKAMMETLGYIPESEVNAALHEALKQIGKKSRALIIRTLWKLGRHSGLSRYKTIRFVYRTVKYYNIYRYDFPPLEGMEETVQWALENGKVGIITSATKDEAEAALEQNPILQKAGVVITRDDVKHIKPHPQSLLLGTKRLGVDPKHSVFVGDLPLDVRAGKNAGMKTIAFLGMFAQFTQEVVLKENPDFIVQDHAELLQILKTHLTPEHLLSQ